MKRRQFIEMSMLTGLGAANPLASSQTSQPQTAIGNPYFRLAVDPAKGTFSVWRGDNPFLLNACAGAAGAGTFDMRDSRYVRTASTRRIQDRLGAGEELTLHAVDSKKEADLELRLTLYDQLDAFFAEVTAGNSGRNPLPVARLEPVRARLEDLSGCFWHEADKVLTNGYMYYDPGRVEDIIFTSRKDIESFWNIALHDARSGHTLVVGSIDNTWADTKIAVGNEPVAVWDSRLNGFNLSVTSLLHRSFVLPPGALVSSGKIMFHAADSPFQALELFAATYAKAFQVQLNPVVNGWCSWFYTHRDITEDEVLLNAEFVAKHLKPYGMQVIQIDDGYYRAFGDWEGNEKFPHGMKWLADRIRALGLTPGLWVAPYVINKAADLAQKHPEYLVKGLDGRPHPIGDGTNFALDITHPGGKEWLRNLFDTVANKWGYDFIKIDFVEWSLLAAPRYHNPAISRAQAYRLGFQIMRDTIGPHRHLLDCGPSQNTVGLLDSVRIELDLPELTWEQYTGRFYANAPAAAKRYYFHGRTWINDDDQLGLAWLTPSQAEAAATIIAMSGGTVISSDRLVDLDPGRMETLTKILPAYGIAARPIDLFRNQFPRIFALPVKRPFGEWLLLAVFNYDTKSTLTEKIALSELGLDPSKIYLAFEFWNREFAGEIRDHLDLNVNPSSVRLLSLREAVPHPQLVGTGRHVTQGALDLDALEWAEPELKGTLNGEAFTRNDLFIHIPKGYRWDDMDAVYAYHLSTGYTAKLYRPNILRLHFQFDKSEKRPFSVKFQRDAKG